MFEVSDTVQEVVQALGTRVSDLRLSRGWTQAELARRSGISLHTVERLESGEGNLRLEGFVAVCQALGSLKGFESVLPAVELSPLDALAGRTLPKRARRKQKTTKTIQWGDDE